MTERVHHIEVPSFELVTGELFLADFVIARGLTQDAEAVQKDASAADEQTLAQMVALNESGQELLRRPNTSIFEAKALATYLTRARAVKATQEAEARSRAVAEKYKDRKVKVIALRKHSDVIGRLLYQAGGRYVQAGMRQYREEATGYIKDIWPSKNKFRIKGLIRAFDVKPLHEQSGDPTVDIEFV